MADNAILASILMGQRRKRDPFEDRRKYALSLMQQGASTAPLQSGSPLEGVARALTAGVGGYFAGQANRDEESRDKRTMGAIGDLLSAATPQERNAKLAGLKDSGADMEVLAPFMAQILGQRMEDERKTALGMRGYEAAGGTMGQGMPPMTLQPQGIPQPGYGAATGPGGITSNNVGNVTDGKGGFRQYPTPQAGAADAATLLQSYPVKYNNGQPMTLLQIAQKYAPADDGKDPMLKGNDPVAWARSVGQIAGLDPNQPLDFDDPAILTKVMQGVNAHEKGRARQQDPSVLQQGVAQAMDPTAFPPTAVPGSIPPGSVANGPPTQLAQGSAPPADGSGTPAPPQAAGPQFDPGADYEALGRRAAQAGDWQAATAYQQKANEARAAFKTEQAKDQTKRAGEGAEWDRRQQEEQRIKKPQEAFSNEKALRGEFEAQPAVKSYRVVVPMLESAKDAATRPTRAADLNLVYAFAKLMDPDSVVRESETGAVVATGSVGDRVNALAGMLTGNAMLSPETRAKLIAELDSRFNALQASHDALAQQYGEMATAYGLKPERIVIPIRTGREGTKTTDNQPSMEELRRWSGGQTGSVPPPPAGFRPL